jgi:hypothetical protein
MVGPFQSVFDPLRHRCSHAREQAIEAGNGVFMGWEPEESRNSLQKIYDNGGIGYFDVLASTGTVVVWVDSRSRESDIVCHRSGLEPGRAGCGERQSGERVSGAHGVGRRAEPTWRAFVDSGGSLCRISREALLIERVTAQTVSATVWHRGVRPLLTPESSRRSDLPVLRAIVLSAERTGAA